MIENNLSNCRNCNHPITANYCAKCGQPVQLKRIDGHYIQHEIIHVLHLEKGIFYTIKELLLRPGQNVRNFIVNDRTRLVKPILFIIITSLIYTLISHFFHIEGSASSIESTSGVATKAIKSWIHNNYGYSNILEGLFIALSLKLFFWKSNYNFYEIVILLCFVMGMGMLIFAIGVLVQGLIHVDLLIAISVIYYIYATWAVGQFFDGKKLMSYIKAFAAYILGMQTFLYLALAIGKLIDLVIL